MDSPSPKLTMAVAACAAIIILPGIAAVPPTITKAFEDKGVRVGKITSLIFTITNSNAATTLTGVTFTDIFPHGLVIATPNRLSAGCTLGSVIGLVTATERGTSVSLAESSLAPAGVCAISVDVTVSFPGSIVNITGMVSSKESGPGTAGAAKISVFAAPPTTSFPLFPWPPPTASAEQVLPRTFLRPASKSPLFKDIDKLLTESLEKNGYFEKSYYAVPQGFALATRLEQIDLAGNSKPLPERWSVERLRPDIGFSTRSVLRALFPADPGYYRILVFIVTNVPFTQSDTTMSQSEAIEWSRAGLNVLPKAIGERLYTNDVLCTALIYEFESKRGSTISQLLLPSRLSANTHLTRSGLLKPLGRK